MPLACLSFLSQKHPWMLGTLNPAVLSQLVHFSKSSDDEHLKPLSMLISLNTLVDGKEQTGRPISWLWNIIILNWREKKNHIFAFSKWYRTDREMSQFSILGLCSIMCSWCCCDSDGDSVRSRIRCTLWFGQKASQGPFLLGFMEATSWTDRSLIISPDLHVSVRADFITASALLPATLR